jgi:hypothetical protein
VNRRVALASAALLLGALAAVAAAPSTQAAGDVVERRVGAGADGLYVFTPSGRPWRNVVVFVHGHGDQREITPYYHRPWLRHLADRGNAVLYPRYETRPGGHGAVGHIERAVTSGLRVLRASPRTPVIGIGYSRGGRLVVDWAAAAAAPHRPRAILSVFPGGSEDRPEDLSRLARGTRIAILVGDRDSVVGSFGAAALLNALSAAGFDKRNVAVATVRSRRGFRATHAAPLSTSRHARAAFWAPADRLIARASARVPQPAAPSPPATRRDPEWARSANRVCARAHRALAALRRRLAPGDPASLVAYLRKFRRLNAQTNAKLLALDATPQIAGDVAVLRKLIRAERAPIAALVRAAEARDRAAVAAATGRLEQVTARESTVFHRLGAGVCAGSS